MDATTNGRELLTLEAAANFLGVSKPTLYRTLSAGDLKGLKAGRQWRFDKADLIAYMNRSPIEFASAPTGVMNEELGFFQSELLKLGHEGVEDQNKMLNGEESTNLLLNSIILLAVLSKASDIHLEPVKTDVPGFLQLRFRVDGELIEMKKLSLDTFESLLMAIKGKAGMEASERRLPQHGRFYGCVNEIDFVFMAAVIPCVFGEVITIRILDSSKSLPKFETIGISESDILRDWIRRPNGIVLFTGPTDSGKETTLFASVRDIASPDRKLFTIEDNIEFLIPHTIPIEINKKTGLTFQVAIKAIWNHDLDILMVRNMEDQDGMKALVELALAGHLILISQPASDSANALRALLDTGIEPLLLSRTTVGIVSQRLLRRICNNCKVSYTPEPNDLSILRLREYAESGGYKLPATFDLYRGNGCEQCKNRGVGGRVVVYERLQNSSALSEAIFKGCSENELREIAVRSGMKTLFAEGIREALEGNVSLEEVFREFAPFSQKV